MAPRENGLYARTFSANELRSDAGLFDASSQRHDGAWLVRRGAKQYIAVEESQHALYTVYISLLCMSEGIDAGEAVTWNFPVTPTLREKCFSEQIIGLPYKPVNTYRSSPEGSTALRNAVLLCQCLGGFSRENCWTAAHNANSIETDFGDVDLRRHEVKVRGKQTGTRGFALAGYVAFQSYPGADEDGEGVV